MLTYELIILVFRSILTHYSKKGENYTACDAFHLYTKVPKKMSIAIEIQNIRQLNFSKTYYNNNFVP
jgi:hypothetical protein